jgi:hypothetical protein
VRNSGAAKQCIWLGQGGYFGRGDWGHAFTDTHGDGIADTILTRRHPDVHTYTYGNADSVSYSYRYTNSYSDRYGSTYGYSLRYAAVQYGMVGGTGFPQRPGPLGGRLFLWGLGPKVLRHGRALGRYSRERLHTSV